MAAACARWACPEAGAVPEGRTPGRRTPGRCPEPPGPGLRGDAGTGGTDPVPLVTQAARRCRGRVVIVADADGWIRSGLSAQRPDGTLHELTLEDGRALVLVRSGGGWFALDGRCPHSGGELAQGDLCGHLLHCPLHAWPFDVRTGTCHEQPGVRLGIHEIRVKDGELQVRPCATLRP